MLRWACALRGFQAIVRDPADLIFVDNGSGGVLTSWVKRQFSALTPLKLEENQLFSGGYNAGIRRAMERGNEYGMITNADAKVVNTISCLSSSGVRPAE
jgi:GT2 family glycosyltransferase